MTYQQLPEHLIVLFHCLFYPAAECSSIETNCFGIICAKNCMIIKVSSWNQWLPTPVPWRERCEFVQIISGGAYMPTLTTFPVQWLCGTSFQVDQRVCSSISRPFPLSALAREPVYTFLLTSMNKIIFSPTTRHALSWVSNWGLITLGLV